MIWSSVVAAPPWTVSVEVPETAVSEERLTALNEALLERPEGFNANEKLERLFRKYVGETPTRYYLGLRLERARQLLLQTSMPILAVGLACGFVSASHFSSSYSQFFGKTPSEERQGSPRRRIEKRPAEDDAEALPRQARI